VLGSAIQEVATAGGNAMDVFTTLAARPAGQGHYVVPMDPRDPEPEIYRCCSASEQEMKLIRMITDSIVRLGYVTSIGVDEITLTKGSVQTGPSTVHIDCSARGQLGLPPLPIWSGKKMVPQPVFFCNQALSSALLGYLEARFPDDEEKKNLLGAPIPATHTLASVLVALEVQHHLALLWNEDKLLRQWLLDQMIFINTEERVMQCHANGSLGAMQTHTTSAAIRAVLEQEAQRTKDANALGDAPQATASPDRLVGAVGVAKASL